INLPNNNDDENNNNINEPSSPPVDIETEKLNLKNIHIGDLIILINNNEQVCTSVINKLLCLFSFHYIDIYKNDELTSTHNQFIYSSCLLSAEQINQHLADVYLRQFGPKSDKTNTQATLQNNNNTNNN